MSQPLIFVLLVLALVVPILGAIVLRVFSPRLSPARMVAGMVVVGGASVLSVVVLAQSHITSLQIGNVTLLLPDMGYAPGGEARPAPPPEYLTGGEEGEDEPFSPSPPLTSTLPLTVSVIAPAPDLPPQVSPEVTPTGVVTPTMIPTIIPTITPTTTTGLPPTLPLTMTTTTEMTPTTGEVRGDTASPVLPIAHIRQVETRSAYA
jgi:hypothetical protein